MGDTTFITLQKKRAPERPWLLRSRLRLFFTLLLLLLIPTGTFTALVTLHVQKQIRKQAIEQNALLVKIMSRALGEEFQRLNKEAEDFANRSRTIELVTVGDNARVQTRLNELLKVSTAFSRAFITDALGNLIGDQPAPHAPPGQNFAQRDWFKGASTAKATYVSEVYTRGLIDGAKVVSICTPIRNADKQIIGYLGAQFKVASIVTWLESSRPAGGTVMVLDHYGKPALSFGEKGLITEDDKIYPQLRSTSGSLVIGDAKSKLELLVNYERVPAANWTIVTAQPAAAVLGPTKALLNTTLIFFSISVAAMAVIGLYWFQTISHFEKQRRRSEEELRAHASSLKQSNRELESLCYSIAHDLRAPLRSMRGFGLALREEYGDGMDEVGRDYVRRICESAEYMDALTDGLLSYGRLTHTELTVSPVDLQIVIRKSCDNLQSEIRNSNACLEVKAPFPSVMADEVVLQQVMENLLSNALKFVEPGQAPAIKVWTEECEGRVLVKVRDNGIGIDPAYHQRIFGVFERLHSREVYAGTGIGLALVRKSVERMGGSVGIESSLGKGSCFWIALQKAPGVIASNGTTTSAHKAPTKSIGA